MSQPTPSPHLCHLCRPDPDTPNPMMHLTPPSLATFSGLFAPTLTLFPTSSHHSLTSPNYPILHISFSITHSPPFQLNDPQFARALPLPPLPESTDIIAKSIYEPVLTNSELFKFPYNDTAVMVGSLSPNQTLALQIGKMKVYLYSENDTASRLGKVRLQL